MREHSGRSAVQGALVLVLALVLPIAASAENEGEIRGHIISINRLYEALEYELALGQVKLARQLPRSTDDEVTLSLYEGIILCEMGKQDLGASLFRAALLLRPGAKLPVQVAPKVDAVFESVRTQVKQEAASILPPSGTEKPSNTAEQKREAPPDSPDTSKQTGSPPDSADSSTPEAPQESHADKAQAPTSVEQAELSNEWLMKRLLRLQGKFLQGDALSKRVPLRELDKISQQIRVAHTTESLREAAHALDDWQQRHLSVPESPPQQAEALRQNVEAGPGTTEPNHEDKAQEPASMDDPEELSSEWFMKRLLRLQGKFLQGDAPSKRVPLRELDKIGQRIRAAHTTESLQEAAHALDAWQQRYLAQ